MNCFDILGSPFTDLDIGIKRRMVLCIIVATLISPISLLILGISYLAYCFTGIGKYHYYMVGSVAISVIIALLFEQQPTAVRVVEILVNNFLELSSGKLIIAWIISDGWSCAVSILIFAIAIFLLPRFDGQSQLLRRELQRSYGRKHRMTTSVIDYMPEVHQLVLGVTGSGKSQYLLKMCEQYLIHTDDMIVFIDGKAAVDEKYGVYQTMKMIASRFGYQIVVLNGTSNTNVEYAMPYNPFDEVMSPDVIRDMVLALMFPDDMDNSAGSEHYKVMFEAYLTEIIQLMLKYHVKVSLVNIVTLLDKNNLCSFIEDPERQIDNADKELMKRIIEENYNDVVSSITKLHMFIQGEGKHIFSCDKQESFNMRSAYRNRQIVIILIDEMSMPTFSAGIARLVNMDLRTLVAGRLNGTIDCNRRCHIIEDEFASYPNKSMLSLLSKARSAMTDLTLSTQSVSDIKAISDDVFGKVVDNIRHFIFFSQNGSDSAQEVANLIGTELTVSSTARSSDGLLTSEASNTLEREYRVSPDEIKALKPNEGIVFDKQSDTVQFFHNRFVKR